MRTILLVLFVMTMFLWLLAALGAFGHHVLLAWFACLWLGLAVFVPAGGGKP